ncbi:hypothetical protein EZV62_011139 [Acer yangbiense]|uniref:Uncharacterized protein n=1 Tax=Acer yangbiense TaxID=1000413 RepID=A0A5C7I4U8_9ROSI|nr:hypothetical protein EZV62_011139 [Acer yangbiense]
MDWERRYEVGLPSDGNVNALLEEEWALIAAHRKEIEDTMEIAREMKMALFWVFMMLALAHTAVFTLLTSSTASSDHDKFSHIGKDSVTPTISIRELMEGRNTPRKNNKGSVNLDDYRPNDPVPGSSAVTSGPIEHGTPLMPYIPKRPPYQPGNVGSPLPPSPA